MEMIMEKVADVSVLMLPGGNLDASNAKDYKRDLSPVIEKNRRMVFDMSKLQFVDSSGLAVLLGCLRQINGVGGDLKLFGMTKPVRALFELVRMHRIFDIYNTREEAINAFVN